MAKNLRIAGAIFLALTIILSCTVVGNKLTDPATYAHTIFSFSAMQTAETR